MKVVALAWRQLRRDLAAGELRILAAALVLAVMAVSAVGFLTDRAERALALEANKLLGGDAVLRADEPIPEALLARARVPGLRSTRTASFPSMVTAGEAVQLGEIRAIGEGFPLRGSFLVETREGGGETVAGAVPRPGRAWMSRSGAQAMGVRVGDTVGVGNLQLRVDALVVQEPEASLNYLNSGPKVFFNLADLPRSGLVQPGSRITWRLVVAGDTASAERFIAQTRPLLGRGQRLETAADARPEIRSALDRADRFLGLAALVSVVLAAIAVAMAARRHAARHLAGSAVMRCLGASQATLVGVHVGELLMLGLFASTVGVLLALALQSAVGGYLAQVLHVAIPGAGWRPAFEGLGVGLTVLLAFGLPPVLALRRVPALRVLRRDLDVGEPSAWVVSLLGLGGLGMLLWWKAGSATLGTAMLGGIAGTLAVLGLIAYALVWLLRRLRTRLRGPWRYGLANVSRRPAASIAQIASLGLGLMVLMLLTFVRTDLLARWQQAMPADAPNRFVINVQQDQVAPVTRLLADQGVRDPLLFPMVRARLVSMNGRPVTGKDFAANGERARRLAEREFNLSFGKGIGKDNEVTAGRFWPASGRTAPELSVEQEFAQTLGWKVGDRVGFDIAGQPFEARITSLRRVEWESFRPNFFVLASPGALDGYAASYIGGVHVERARAGEVTRGLVRAFPNLTVIDVDAVLDQVRGTVAQVSRVVEAIFYFSLAAGVLVLLASVSASQDERLREAAVMRVLGGTRRQLLLAQASEFAAVGAITGLVAAIAATILAGVVARQVFDLPFTADWGLVGTSTALGILASMVAGLAATRRVLSAPPTVVLRELQE
jgi:putative ABC transport system permease protein